MNTTRTGPARPKRNAEARRVQALRRLWRDVLPNGEWER